MPDSIALVLAALNSFLAFGGVLMTVWGQYYFKSGVLVKTLRRGTLAAVLLFLHFLLQVMESVGLSSAGGFESVLELLFTLALAYTTYGFINDWRSLNEA